MAYTVDILLNILNTIPDGPHQFFMPNITLQFYSEKKTLFGLFGKCPNMFDAFQNVSMRPMFIYFAAIWNHVFVHGECGEIAASQHLLLLPLLKRGSQNGEQLSTDVEECLAVSQFNCDVLWDQPTEVSVYSAVTSSWLMLADSLL